MLAPIQNSPKLNTLVASNKRTTYFVNPLKKNVIIYI